MEYQSLIQRVSNQLVQKGWKTTESPNQIIDLAVTRDETTTLVTTRALLAFVDGERIPKDQIQKIVKEIHEQRKKSAAPPLFPSTNIVVFAFKEARDVEWILKEAKKRDLFATNYTVSWTIDLTKEILRTHKGLPIIQSGAQEIKEALNSI